MDEPEAPPQVPRWSAEVVRTDRWAVGVVTGDLDTSGCPGFADRLLRLTGGLRIRWSTSVRVRLLAGSGVRELQALAYTIAGTGKRRHVSPARRHLGHRLSSMMVGEDTGAEDCRPKPR
ncbi:hypothetical protein AB0F15_24310 [Amycolatopsis sp. NPDC026612]|uniref:hypothetical protein n=1 Tax=Amycolatopsis sp. NPDC026612 TaxID=3155466 RepID=UPI0033F261FE